MPLYRVCCMPVLAVLASAVLVVVLQACSFRQMFQHWLGWDAAATEQAATVQVTEVSRALAVHTMQLQMEYVAASLEDEALDLAERSPSAQLLLNR